MKTYTIYVRAEECNFSCRDEWCRRDVVCDQTGHVELSGVSAATARQFVRNHEQS